MIDTSFDALEDFPGISEEETAKVISERRNLYQPILKVFKEEHLTEYDEIIYSPTVTELDQLILTGGISMPELNEYTSLLPEAHEVNKRLYQLAEKMADEYAKEKLPALMKMAIDGSGKLVNVKKFTDLFNLIYTLRMGRAILGELPSYRNGRLNDFHIALQQKIMMRALHYVDKTYQNPQSRNRALDSLYEVMEGQVNVNDPRIGGPLQTLKKQLVLVDGTRKNFIFSSQGIAKSEGDFEDLSAEEDEELTELATYRKTLPVVHSYGPYSYITYLDNIEDALQKRAHTLCYVVLFLSKDEITINNFSSKVRSHQPGRMLYLHVDRSTGKLHLADTGIKLEEVYTNSEYAQRLEAHIHKDLLAYLRNQNELVDISGRTKVTTAQQIQSVEVDVQDAVSNTIREEISDEIQQKPVEQEPTQSLIPVPLEISTKETRFDFSLLSNLSSTTVKRALDKLLDKPVRISGSHHIYRTIDGSGTYPIPFHAKKKMGTGLLRKCLKMYGIQPEVFYRTIN